MSIDLIFFWTAVGLYGTALFPYIRFISALGGASGRFFLALAGGGLVFHTISLGLRWVLSGHMPGDNLYELNALGGWFAVLLFFLVQKHYPRLRVLGGFVLLIVLGMMVYGVSRPHVLGPLSPEYQSPWFYVHILSAFLAYGCYVIATGGAGLYLLRSHGRLSGWADRLPSQDFLEDINSRYVLFGFSAHAVMLASGSLWAHTAWGSYWKWDPVETWSLATWLVYAFHLHARTFLGWGGRRLAWITLAALVAIFFTFWGVPHLPTATQKH